MSTFFYYQIMRKYFWSKWQYLTCNLIKRSKFDSKFSVFFSRAYNCHFMSKLPIQWIHLSNFSIPIILREKVKEWKVNQKSRYLLRHKPQWQNGFCFYQIAVTIAQNFFVPFLKTQYKLIIIVTPILHWSYEDKGQPGIVSPSGSYDKLLTHIFAGI